MLAAAGVTQAGITGTITGVSDYDFRGYTQTGNDPALQGSLDFSTDNGFYAGVWASSSLDFGNTPPASDADYEVDLYTGFNFGGGEGKVGYSLNAVWYTYPSASDFNFPEISAGMTYNIFAGKLWYSWDFANSSQDAWYLEGNLNFPLPQDFGFAVHAGYSGGDYWKSFDGEYLDLSVGLTKTFGHIATSLKYVDTSGAVWDHTTHAFSGEGKLLFTIGTTFPWSNE